MTPPSKLIAYHRISDFYFLNLNWTGVIVQTPHDISNLLEDSLGVYMNWTKHPDRIFTTEYNLLDVKIVKLYGLKK